VWSEQGAVASEISDDSAARQSWYVDDDLTQDNFSSRTSLETSEYSYLVRVPNVSKLTGIWSVHANASSDTSLTH
jgi:hypothetical protein